MINKQTISKINFNQKRYVIPAIALLPLLFLGHSISTIANHKVEDKEESVETEYINTDLPKPAAEELVNKSKYQSMLSAFGKQTEAAAVLGIDKETDDKVEIDRIYTDEELQTIDSMNRIRANQMEELKGIENQILSSQTSIENTSTSSRTDMEEYRQQLDMIERVARGEKIKTPEEIEQEKIAAAVADSLKKREEERALLERPVEVSKSGRPNESYFNTLGDNNEQPLLIKAMLDQDIKVVDGNRIRIRLMDDVIINDNLLERGTYLFATVTGFGVQRVKAKVTSILVNDKFIKVALNIYDNDGMEGFYVPESAFRDLAKEAGAQAMQQNINMNSSSGDQNFESFAFQTLQGIYQSTSQALSKAVKKNKAKLKYNTTVYLINDKN